MTEKLRTSADTPRTRPPRRNLPEATTIHGLAPGDKNAKAEARPHGRLVLCPLLPARIPDRPGRGLTRGVSSAGAFHGSVRSDRTRPSPVSAILVAEDLAFLTHSWSERGSEGEGRRNWGRRGGREYREDEGPIMRARTT